MVTNLATMKPTLSNTRQLEPDESALATAINDYLLSHFAQKITEQHLADHFKTTTYFIREVFPLAYNNKTPPDLILEYRMAKAAELLLSPDKNIANNKYIAGILGYSTPSNFARAFKTYYNTSPKNYIKKNKIRQK
jgi:AraC-like DNA-binding protein